jgi:predicted TIM-barrel fold metal-dependent hydrolase
MARSDTSLGSPADLDVVVDTDAHIAERPEQIVPYLDEPYANLFGSKGGAAFTAPSYPKDELFRSLGGKVQWDAVDTADDWQEAISRFGIDYAVITPTLNLYLPIFSDERFAHALSKAYNDFVVDEFLESGHDEFKAAITLSPLEPDRAAEEIDRLGDHPDMVAGIVGSTGVFPPLGDVRYDPIFEALADNDLPLLLHGATGSFISAHPFIKRGLKTYWELHIVSHPFSQMIQLSSMIGQGIPERHPDVDIVMQEAGLGWIPYTMYRMDNEFGKRRSEVPLLERKPSEYIKDQFYFTSQPMAEPEATEHVAWFIEMFDGQENLMFSTDYPHYDFDTPDELFRLVRSHFDDRAVRNIFGETAVDVFDLG